MSRTAAFHLARAVAWWVPMLPVVLLLGWQESVFLVLIYSTYANSATDMGAYFSTRAKEEAES